MAEASMEFDAAAARLSEYTTRAVPWLWEVCGLDEFVAIARAQVPPGLAASHRASRTQSAAKWRDEVLIPFLACTAQRDFW